MTSFEFKRKAKMEMESLIDECVKKAYQEGVEAGLQVATSIHNRYSKNHYRLEPHPIKQLEKWAKTDIEDAREQSLY